MYPDPSTWNSPERSSSPNTVILSLSPEPRVYMVSRNSCGSGVSSATDEKGRQKIKSASSKVVVVIKIFERIISAPALACQEYFRAGNDRL
jgi:hypothetical protein